MESNGLVPVHLGAESAAYESTDLHPRVTPSGRYAYEAKPYVYQGGVSGNTGRSTAATIPDWRDDGEGAGHIRQSGDDGQCYSLAPQG
jgi:hypothetical protein